MLRFLKRSQCLYSSSALPKAPHFFVLDELSSKPTPIEFKLPSRQQTQQQSSNQFEIKLLEQKFKSEKFSNKDIEKYLELFAASPRIKEKSLALGIDGELYNKYAKLFTLHIKKDKLDSMSIANIRKRLMKNTDIEKCILPEFYQFLLMEAPEKTKILDSLMSLSDLRSPAAQFEHVRALKRKIILHVGPTNSGKTHSAMQMLQASKTGIYLGPLRLLAHEIYERLNEKGIPCNLITGEEKRIQPSAKLFSCTVEMALLDKAFDVAVIDEIQMIGDNQRGWAWTNAFLGLQAKEIHLCGEASVNALIQSLCEVTGDELIVNEYKRLSPLRIQDKPLKCLSQVKKGDCIITFSRKDIFGIKREIENRTSFKCALIYGNLPPEIRSEQAKLFNAKDSGFDVLVASDAVGMGLNLNISRIIFDTVEKFSGLIAPTHAKQIAGRAGRFGSDYAEGFVAATDRDDAQYLRQCLKSPIVPVESAGLLPTYSQIEAFNRQLPNQTLGQLLEKFEYLAMVDGNFFLCNFENQKNIANLIEALPLSLLDRFIFILAPVNAKKTLYDVMCLLKFATSRANNQICSISDVIKIPQETPTNGDSLFKLEVVHKSISLYLWLSQRMPDTFVDQILANTYKARTEAMIQEALLSMKYERRKKAITFNAPSES